MNKRGKKKKELFALSLPTNRHQSNDLFSNKSNVQYYFLSGTPRLLVAVVHWKSFHTMTPSILSQALITTTAAPIIAQTIRSDRPNRATFAQAHHGIPVPYRGFDKAACKDNYPSSPGLSKGESFSPWDGGGRRAGANQKVFLFPAAEERTNGSSSSHIAINILPVV